MILGPTAAGKTAVAIHLAERLNGEIVSADSRLFYRGLDIGTAKPTLLERRGIPHHLIDVTEPDSPWSLAKFQEEAHLAISKIRAMGHLPILVGGTGQYLRAVTQGWQPPQVEPDSQLRGALQRWAVQIGPAGLHHRLSVLDPIAATSIDARNVRRTIRALEVIFKTGERFSRQRETTPSHYQTLQVGLMVPRDQLYERIDQRVESMLAAGLIDEVRDLLQRGYSPDLPAFSAIGYKQVIAYLQGRITLEQLRGEMKRATRILVRRQANWFKLTDPEIHWFDLTTAQLTDIEKFIRNWLEEGKQQIFDI